jgi:hypothetical protein
MPLQKGYAWRRGSPETNTTLYWKPDHWDSIKAALQGIWSSGQNSAPKPNPSLFVSFFWRSLKQKREIFVSWLFKDEKMARQENEARTSKS